MNRVLVTKNQLARGTLRGLFQRKVLKLEVRPSLCSSKFPCYFYLKDELGNITLRQGLNGALTCTGSNLFGIMNPELERRKEFERRKKLRLLQVRQQSKEFTDKLRERIKGEIIQQKKKYLESENKLKQEKHLQELCKLKELYDRCLESIGEGHKEAAKQPDLNLEKQADLVRISATASKRGAKAVKKHLEEETIQKKNIEAPVKQRKAARNKENLRAFYISSLPKNAKNFGPLSISPPKSAHWKAEPQETRRVLEEIPSNLTGCELRLQGSQKQKSPEKLNVLRNDSKGQEKEESRTHRLPGAVACASQPENCLSNASSPKECSCDYVVCSCHKSPGELRRCSSESTIGCEKVLDFEEPRKKKVRSRSCSPRSVRTLNYFGCGNVYESNQQSCVRVTHHSRSSKRTEEEPVSNTVQDVTAPKPSTEELKKRTDERSAKALRKEQLKRDFQQLVQNLKKLTQEKSLISSKTKGNLRVFSSERDIRTRNETKQKKLNNAFEKLPHSLNSSKTRNTDIQQPDQVPTDGSSPPTLNLALCQTNMSTPRSQYPRVRGGASSEEVSTVCRPGGSKSPRHTRSSHKVRSGSPNVLVDRDPSGDVHITVKVSEVLGGRSKSPSPSRGPGERSMSPLPSRGPGERSMSPLPSRGPCERSMSPLPSRVPGERSMFPSLTRGPGERSMSPLPSRGPCESSMSPLPSRGPGERSMSPLPSRGPCERSMSPLPSRGPGERSMFPSLTRGPGERSMPPSPNSGSSYMRPPQKLSPSEQKLIQAFIRQLNESENKEEMKKYIQKLLNMSRKDILNCIDSDPQVGSSPPQSTGLDSDIEQDLARLNELAEVYAEKVNTLVNMHEQLSSPSTPPYIDPIRAPPEKTRSSSRGATPRSTRSTSPRPRQGICPPAAPSPPPRPSRSATTQSSGYGRTSQPRYIPCPPGPQWTPEQIQEALERSYHPERPRTPTPCYIPALPVPCRQPWGKPHVPPVAPPRSAGSKIPIVAGRQPRATRSPPTPPPQPYTRPPTPLKRPPQPMVHHPIEKRHRRVAQQPTCVQPSPTRTPQPYTRPPTPLKRPPQPMVHHPIEKRHRRVAQQPTCVQPSPTRTPQGPRMPVAQPPSGLETSTRSTSPRPRQGICPPAAPSPPPRPSRSATTQSSGYGRTSQPRYIPRPPGPQWTPEQIQGVLATHFHRERPRTSTPCYIPAMPVPCRQPWGKPHVPAVAPPRSAGSKIPIVAGRKPRATRSPPTPPPQPYTRPPTPLKRPPQPMVHHPIEKRHRRVAQQPTCVQSSPTRTPQPSSRPPNCPSRRPLQLVSLSLHNRHFLPERPRICMQPSPTSRTPEGPRVPVVQPPSGLETINESPEFANVSGISTDTMELCFGGIPGVPVPTREELDAISARAANFSPLGIPPPPENWDMEAFFNEKRQKILEKCGGTSSGSSPQQTNSPPGPASPPDFGAGFSGDFGAGFSGDFGEFASGQEDWGNMGFADDDFSTGIDTVLQEEAKPEDHVDYPDDFPSPTDVFGPGFDWDTANLHEPDFPSSFPGESLAGHSMSSGTGSVNLDTSFDTSALEGPVNPERLNALRKKLSNICQDQYRGIIEMLQKDASQHQLRYGKLLEQATSDPFLDPNATLAPIASPTRSGSGRAYTPAPPPGSPPVITEFQRTGRTPPGDLRIQGDISPSDLSSCTPSSPSSKRIPTWRSGSVGSPEFDLNLTQFSEFDDVYSNLDNLMLLVKNQQERK